MATHPDPPPRKTAVLLGGVDPPPPREVLRVIAGKGPPMAKKFAASRRNY
jgi:hypothetical protein